MYVLAQPSHHMLVLRPRARGAYCGHLWVRSLSVCCAHERVGLTGVVPTSVRYLWRATMATGRILVVEDADDEVLVHYEDGDRVSYNTWSDMLDSVDLADVETFNFFFDDTDSYHQNGVAPLTAYPVVGTTKRESGQGCQSCRYFYGCLATQGMRGQLHLLTAEHGLACTSWVLKVR